MPKDIAGLGGKGEKPRLNPLADLTSQRLTPVEGFVLSRVDGTSSYEQICLMTGLGVEPTIEILRKLRRTRLIVGPGDQPTPPEIPRAEADRAITPVPAIVRPPRPAYPRAQRPSADERPLLEKLDDRTPVDPAEIATGPDLSPETKLRVVRLHRRLKRIGHYDVLGLRRGASHEAVKRAYFLASKELHPDRYYGKDIGAFREKLGDIFVRLTEAFQAIESEQAKSGKQR